MPIDFSDILQEYRELAAETDKLFEAVAKQCPDEVACEKGCSDCCHAIFDLSFVEAYFLNQAFLERYEGTERDAILMRADEAERRQHKLVRKALKGKEEGADSEAVLEELARQRVRCPLLSEEHECVMYDVRPITCRLYGAPIAFEGQVRTCGRSGFEEGKPYPTVKLDRIQDRLVDLSARMVERLNTRYPGLATMHVPASVALMNNYDAEYLGLKEEEPEEDASLADALPGDGDDDIWGDGFDQSFGEGPADPNAFQPGRRMDFPAEECASCSTSDCGGCDKAGPGGCSGEPTIIEFGGPARPEDGEE
ncbi:YkgJ family cysteine cluster protein [Desulfohalovibrio reitneri]|uniref:YkgJ family cysteine cluster protein n=1 Tax=Desulfohalovibrio reitneri TaxID=1307759 RepID=UPI0004A6AC63|nr:YkgJ family cysteine cluster protein [Desulfohalovibrio reitneri]